MPRTGTPIGLALRIGPLAGLLTAKMSGQSGWLRSRIPWLRKPPITWFEVCELQIDFDCAEAKAGRLCGVGRRHSPPGVADASGHHRPARLAEAPGLQKIGSCSRRICAPGALAGTPQASGRCFQALRSRTGPAGGGASRRISACRFRVALPTYGYMIAFDSKGAFAGLSAEGPMRNWQPDMQLREVRSDAAAMAGLVRGWNLERPEPMRGIIWYRLPVEGDVLNWSWPTLSRVMTGETPGSSLRAEVRRPQPGLIELTWSMKGMRTSPATRKWWQDGQARSPWRATVCGDLSLAAIATNVVCFRNSHQPLRIRPQERQMIGWLRLAADAKVDC